MHKKHKRWCAGLLAREIPIGLDFYDLTVTDSDFKSRHAFEPGRQPSFCQHTTRLSVRASRVMAQSGRLVLRSGQLTCPETLRTRLRRQGMRELGRLWEIEM